MPSRCSSVARPCEPKASPSAMPRPFPAGKKLWQNECAGTVEGLTSWNQGEDFASLGIGHYIWYPEGKRGPFEESFPDLVRFLVAGKVVLPSWLAEARACPWSTRAGISRGSTWSAPDFVARIARANGCLASALQREPVAGGTSEDARRSSSRPARRHSSAVRPGGGLAKRGLRARRLREISRVRACCPPNDTGARDGGCSRCSRACEAIRPPVRDSLPPASLLTPPRRF